MISLLLAIIYLSFISLGLPDSLLGSVWPIVYPELGVPVSWSGIIFMLISLMTVVSSLLSDRMNRKFGAGKVTAMSVAMTAAALLGFSISHNFWLLCIWAIPYGLGAGSVDAALNNYVALHFESHHMSWLHCMWGLGASAGPYIMSAAITRTGSWNNGYRAVGILQVFLSAAIFLSLPLWKKQEDTHSGEEEAVNAKPLSLKEVLGLPGAKEVLIAFFCYCALEQTVGLWTSSYLVLHRGVPAATATAFASLFYIGITVGRAINGFLTFKLSDTQLINLGHAIIGGGILLVALPLPQVVSLAGFIAIGLGCAPIYPSFIHSTPAHFGRENSQAMVGVQMASAYIGLSIMPPLFGFLADRVGIGLLPFYLILILAVEVFMYGRLVRVSE